MMQGENDDDSDLLYERFVASLKFGDDFSSYDTDELIEIFDRAYIDEDEYVGYEVLNVAQRYYPDNKLLGERRIVFYYNRLALSTILQIAQNLSNGSFIARVLEGHEFTDLNRHLEHYSKLISDVNDGALDEVYVMFLCEVLVKLDLIKLLEELAASISAISTLPTAVYSFLFNYYYEQEDYDNVIKYGRDITDIEPFDDSVWGVMALYQAYLGESREAIDESADYALAINPDNINAMLAKAYSNIVDNPKECIRICDAIIAKDDEALAAAYYKAFAAKNLGDPFDTGQYLMEYFERGGSYTLDVFELFYSSVDTKTKVKLEAFLKSTFHQESYEKLYSRCFSLIEREDYDAAESMTFLYGEFLDLITQDDGAYLEQRLKIRFLRYVALYGMGRFDYLLKVYNESLQSGLSEESDTSATLMALVCSYKIGKSPEALLDRTDSFILKLRKRQGIKASDDTGRDIARTLYYLENFRRMLSGESVNVWEYNPLYEMD